MCLLNVFPQEYSMTHYTVASGLPQSQAMGIMQDSRGYFWISTKNGVAQFDGFEFKVFYEQDGLPESNIAIIIENDKGQVIAGRGKGYALFDGYRFQPLPRKIEPEHFIIQSLGDCFFETLYFGDSVGFFTYDGDTSVHYGTVYKEFGIFDPVNPIFAKPNPSTGNIFFIARDTLFVQKNKINVPINHIANKNIAISKGITYLLDHDNVFTYNNGDIRSIDIIEKDDEIIDPIFAARYHYNQIIQLFNTEVKTKLFWNNQITTGFLLDKDSVLWIPSEGGLFKLETTAFLNLFPEHGLYENIWSIVEGNHGEMYFASLGQGVQKYENYQLSHFNEIDQFKKASYYGLGSVKLSDGRLLFTSFSDILQYDDGHFSFFHEHSNQVEYIFENPYKNEILYGNRDGLWRVRKDKFELFSEYSSLNNKYIRCISYDGKGKYYLALEDGFSIFDGTGFVHYPSDSLPTDQLLSTEVDSSGNVWFGGKAGLFYFDSTSNNLTAALPTGTNIMVKFIKNIDPDKVLVGRLQDLLIINTDLYFAGNKDAITILDEIDGYLGIEPKQNGIRRDRNGRFWINCSNGVIRFDPTKLRKNSVPPSLYFKEIHVKSDSLHWVKQFSMNNYDTTQIENIRLSHTQNNLRIYFSAISSFRQERIRYRYRWANKNNNWSHEQEENFIEYQNLKPGQYQLELIASNGDGVWTPEPASIHIYIKPALWQTLGFRVSLTLLILLLTVYATTLVNRKRAAIRRDREEIVSEYNAMQMNQLIRQFDPHFTFNIINSIGALILNKETDKAYTYFTKLSRLLRSVLTRHDIFTRTLREELEVLNDYCSIQKYQLKDRFEYSIETDDKVNLDFKVPKMLIQNFVENAIKHGINPKPEGGEVRVTISATVNEIHITITDNGVGREASKNNAVHGTKSGSRITSQLFRLIEKQTGKEVLFNTTDLYDKNMKASGTKVTMIFPSDLSL